MATIGAVPRGLPALGWPSIPADDYAKLATAARSIFVGLALANFGAGLTGTFVVNGSPTKTAVVDNAGGRS